MKNIMTNPKLASRWMPDKPEEDMTSEDWERHFDEVNRSLIEVSETVSAINNNIDDFRMKARAQAELILRAAEGWNLG